MAPRSKRARTESMEVEETDTVAQKDSISKPQPHETLWNEDGNIVLATDAYLYRVHKGVLARNSTCFKDMFQLPNTGDVDGKSSDGAGVGPVSENWNGVPLVKMVGDEDGDVYNFLMTLYDRSYYRMHEMTTLEIMKSLIVMSTKYDCQEIRSEIVKHLTRHFPDNLAAYDKEKTTELFDNPPADSNFQLLSVALKLDAPLVLPSLYYACASHPLEVIFKASHILSKKDMETIIIGRERLSKFSYEFGIAALSPQKECESLVCIKKKTSLLIKHLDKETYDPPTLPLQTSAKGIFALDCGKHVEICRSCAKCYCEDLKKARETFWDHLSIIFGMDDWPILRERTAS